MADLKNIIRQTDDYNFHSHTQFCDGRDSIEEIASAAYDAGMQYWGITPHSPVTIESSCNMRAEDMGSYLAETVRMKEEYDGRMKILASLEIDYLGSDWGPHVDYFQNLKLDYRLGSVHFVPNKSGVLYDCDGNYSHFKGVLHEGFRDDVRYVAEKYFEQVLFMIERGGFDLLGHFDKIGDNASHFSPGIEEEGWYESYVDDIISAVQASGLVVEINTKAYAEKGRFFPAVKWLEKMIGKDIPLAVDSDAHYSSKVAAGRKEALELVNRLKKKI